MTEYSVVFWLVDTDAKVDSTILNYKKEGPAKIDEFVFKWIKERPPLFHACRILSRGEKRNILKSIWDKLERPAQKLGLGDIIKGKAKELDEMLRGVIRCRGSEDTIINVHILCVKTGDLDALKWQLTGGDNGISMADLEDEFLRTIYKFEK